MPPKKSRDLRPGARRQKNQTIRSVLIEADKTTVTWDDGTTDVLGVTDAIEVE